jgi:N-acetylmuramoyl-L-alanine amidase
MRRSIAALFFGALLASSIPPLLIAQAGLRVISREGTRTLLTTTLNNQEYVALDDVATGFGLTLREDRLAGGVTATAGTRSVIITPDQPVVSVAGRLVSLSTAPVRQGNRWLVPLDFLQRAVGPVLDTRVELRRPSRLVVVGDARVPRINVRNEPSQGSATVVIDITPATPQRLTTETGQLTVSFDADALDLNLPSVAGGEFLQAIQPGGTPTSIRIVPGPKFALHRSTTAQPDATSSRLTIELLPAGTEPPTAPPPAPPATPPAAAADPLPLPLPATGVRTVVIDAGHGGEDVGARGAGGTLEKDVTLGIARRLRTMIESRLGLRVFVTRDEDRVMGLDDRAAYANSQRADVFISIHANAALQPTLKGAEVYYLSADSVDGSQDIPDGSSTVVLPSLGGGTRAIGLVRWEAAQVRHVQRSSSLAGSIEQALRARVEMSARPVQQAPFRVLVGAAMPAVLVEVGYLSNAEEEKALASGNHQERIAQALFDGLVQFRAQVERTLTPPAASQQ